MTRLSLVLGAIVIMRAAVAARRSRSGHRHALGHRRRRLGTGAARRHRDPRQRSDRRDPDHGHERSRRVHVPRRAARHVHRDGGALRLPPLRAAAQRREREQPALARRREARDRHAVRGGHGHGAGNDRRDEEQRLLRPADRDADSADSDKGPRRGEPAASAARRALRERHRRDGRQLRLADSEHRGTCRATGPTSR